MDNPVAGTDGKLGRGFMSADKLEEINIGNDDKPRPTFINANLESGFREELIKLLKEYKDCFAWDYWEMPGLDHSIVEHRLPIKPGFRPYKQPPRKIYKDEVLADVKKEVERLLDANFIRSCRYAEWNLKYRPCLQEKWEDEGSHRFQRCGQSYSHGWIPNACC
jgi:hypothetical protein